MDLRPFYFNVTKWGNTIQAYRFATYYAPAFLMFFIDFIHGYFYCHIFFNFNIALLHLILKFTVMLFWIWDFFLSSDPSICYTKGSPFIEIFQCCCLSFHYFLPNLNGVLPFHRTAFEILVPFGTTF